MINNRNRKIYLLSIFTIFLIKLAKISYSYSNPYDKGYDDNDERSRIWKRIEENGINHKVYRFLNDQSITNCFEYLEEPRLLRLRCLSEYELFDVDIFVYRRNPNDNNNYNYNNKKQLTFNATNWNQNSQTVTVSINEM